LGRVEVWQRVLEVRDDRVLSEIHYRFAASGEELVSTSELRFRSQAGLRRSLAEAGFSVERVFGDWDRGPVQADSPELIFVAARAERG
jgi:hypothetical protein